MPKWLNRRETAAMLGISPDKVTQLAAQKVLPCLPGKTDGARQYLKFNYDSVNGYLQTLQEHSRAGPPVVKKVRPAAAQATPPAPRASGAPQTAGDDELVPLVEAARREGLSPTALSWRIRNGDFGYRTIHIGRRHFVYESSLGHHGSKGAGLHGTNGTAVLQAQPPVEPPVEPASQPPPAPPEPLQLNDLANTHLQLQREMQTLTALLGQITARLDRLVTLWE